MTAREALAYIDATLYANQDSGPDITWRNDEVLELLDDVRRVLVAESKGSGS